MKKIARGGMIWAVILAAGESKRMGRPKLLLPYRSATVIEAVVRSALASKIDRVVVVLGAHRGKIKEKISRLPVETAVNARFRKGMLSSVQCGLGALPAASGAAVVLLADQPGVTAKIINRLLSAFRSSGKGIVVPVWREKRGHPLVIDLKYRPEIMRLSRRIGLRQLLRRHADDILEVRLPDRAVFHDIDTAEDYQKALRR